MSTLLFKLPPGIGDISWCYSKILDICNKHHVSVEISNDPPKRGLEFAKLLPGIKALGWSNSWANLEPFRLKEDVDLSKLQSGQYVIFANRHLESGKTLAEFHPYQNTNYHYQINTTEENRHKADQLLSKFSNSKKVAFYCSSYNHRPEYGFWNWDEWVIFLENIKSKYPDIVFIAMGANYDDKTKQVAETLKKKGNTFIIDCVGKTDIGTAIEILKKCKYFFSFPSGLGILSDVINVPCTMWYWGNVPGSNTQKFFNTYADPVNISSMRHVNLPYISVSESLDKLSEYLGKFI